jgi:Domain of unknown function (DUF4304)
MASPASEQMKSIVTDLGPFLKRTGFRKRGHSFNHMTEGGLTHVVDFQMGTYMPPGTGEFPPIRVNLYGKFTVNLGVFVPSLARRLNRPDKPKWVNDYDCHLRERLGAISPERSDIWWSLDEPTTAVAAVDQRLNQWGLPWLDRFRLVRDITEAFMSDGSHDLGLPPVGPLHVGLLLLDEGEVSQAEALVSAYLADSTLHSNHRAYLADFLPRQGLGHLLPPEGT